ncbi:ProQ/FINO family protein [Photobacterium galatheae]|uniref:ProQ/FinO domain-containing protein n=1 Tax=Photobacterium galatheae TaxID=1654360 RepID=A0A066RKM2_9GAMM|nr:ProQ/FINO family protein [Photobacterium galatheae]KDM91000.1 hypothetical protein EA58_14715 [Photobacterium galatheae]MCM0149046.1 hypothetical protein [Photobacterium galatheae]
MNNNVSKKQKEVPRYHLRRQKPSGQKNNVNNTHQVKPKKKQNTQRKMPAKKMAKTKVKTLKSFLLCKKFWPRVFNIYNPKPLCKGMRQVLLEDAENRGIKVSNSTVYNALFWMTSTIQYKQALVRYHARFDHQGEIIGVVSEVEKAKAQEYIDNAPTNVKKVAAKAVEKAQRARSKHHHPHGVSRGSYRPRDQQGSGRPANARQHSGKGHPNQSNGNRHNSGYHRQFNQNQDGVSLKTPTISYRSRRSRRSASSEVVAVASSDY